MWLQEPRFGFRIFIILFQSCFLALLLQFNLFSQIHCLLEQLLPGIFFACSQINFFWAQHYTLSLYTKRHSIHSTLSLYTKHHYAVYTTLLYTLHYTVYKASLYTTRTRHQYTLYTITLYNSSLYTKQYITIHYKIHHYTLYTITVNETVLYTLHYHSIWYNTIEYMIHHYTLFKTLYTNTLYNTSLYTIQNITSQYTLSLDTRHQFNSLPYVYYTRHPSNWVSIPYTIYHIPLSLVTIYFIILYKKHWTKLREDVTKASSFLDECWSMIKI